MWKSACNEDGTVKAGERIKVAVFVPKGSAVPENLRRYCDSAVTHGASELGFKPVTLVNAWDREKACVARTVCSELHYPHPMHTLSLGHDFPLSRHLTAARSLSLRSSVTAWTSSRRVRTPMKR